MARLPVSADVTTRPGVGGAARRLSRDLSRYGRAPARALPPRPAAAVSGGRPAPAAAGPPPGQGECRAVPAPGAAHQPRRLRQRPPGRRSHATSTRFRASWRRRVPASAPPRDGDARRPRHVAGRPARCREVIAEQLLLPADEQQPGEPADRQERLSPGHRPDTRGSPAPAVPAGHRRARTRRHQLIGRVRRQRRADQDTRGDEADPRARVQHRRRPGQRSGAHQESSSLSATCRVRARRTPRSRAQAPWLRRNVISSACGNARRTMAAVPSREPLSTTTTGGRSGSAASRASVRASSARRLRVAITTSPAPMPARPVPAGTAAPLTGGARPGRTAPDGSVAAGRVTAARGHCSPVHGPQTAVWPP